MRVVARHAGCLAFEETSALAEVDGLMADVPGILKVCRDALGGWHAMTLSAVIVHLRWRHLSRVCDVRWRRFRRVLRSGTMTGFATYALFRRLNRARFGDAQFSSGMALKATEQIRIRREGSILDSGGVAMAGGERESTVLVLREPVFEVSVFVELRDVSDRLRACTEGPALSGAHRQSLRVMGLRLLYGNLGMANGAGLRRNEILRHEQNGCETRR